MSAPVHPSAARRFTPAEIADMVAKATHTSSHGCTVGNCRCPRSFIRCALYTDYPQQYNDPIVHHQHSDAFQPVCGASRRDGSAATYNVARVTCAACLEGWVE